jgi:hypothetical protein
MVATDLPPRRGFRPWFVVWLALAFPIAGRAAPSWEEQQSALCTAAIATAEQRSALPPGLLGTIARVESGRPIATMSDVRAWPWTINADGAGLFFESRAAALAWATQGVGRGVRLMDVGCLQVNLQAHPAAFRSMEEAFDPVANADYAARFLRALATEANGDWNVATGMYHSRTPDLAAAYRNRVAAMGAGIITGIGGPEPLYVRAMRQGTLRLTLGGGRVLMVNTHRQPPGRRPRSRSPCEVAAVLAPLLSQPPQVRGCRVASG